MDRHGSGSDARDALFRRTGQYLPKDGSGITYDERPSPCRAALLAGRVPSDAEARNRAAEVILEEVEADERAREHHARYGWLSPAARYHK